jgi:NADP-dependent 3-hydroxy acid dehydrogenase YdfG/acyl carrier protein
MIMLSGMLRTVAIEVPFHVRVIDCDHSEASFQVLDRLLQSVYHEDEVILREGQIFGNTFARTTSAFPNRERTKNYQDFTTPKYLIESKNTDEKPHFQAFTFDPLEKNEVLIKIDLASFDRKGIENNSIFGQHHRVVGIVGIIDKIGSEVSGGISIGDRVCTLISTTNLQSHVVVPACTCTQFSFWHSDDNISKLKDGVIAWLVLVTMSKLKGGENVLIDIKDSTDMGLYMNAIASDCASNPYIYTRNMKEEPKFHKEVKVLSTEDLCSMPAHFDVLVVDSVKKLTRSHLSSMRPFGRIVVTDNPSKEIDATTIEFARRKFLHILPFDFKSIISVAPEVLKDAIQSIIKMEKKLTIPARINKFKVHELRGVKSIKHSKSVIADFQKDNALVLTTMEATKSISYAEKDAVIITGGCAGFGLRSALELADWGLKHIVLASRRGIVQDSDKMSVEKLEGKGVNVMAFSLDVTKRGDLSNALDKLKKEGLSVCGILHSATIYADNFIAELSKDHFMLSYETKAKGAWNLHVETLKLKLKFFICYSSVVVSIGNQGQSAYAASNAFLDGLIAFRVAQGLEGTSIRWGKIGEVGLMARNKYVDNLQERMGVLAVTPKEGLTLMKEIILRGHYQITIHNCTWQKIRKASTVLDSITQQKTGPFIARWEAVNSLMVLDKLQRLKSIEGRLVDSIERITGYTSLTGNTALETLGIDSLAATEIQFAIDESISVNIEVMEIFDSVDIAHLSTKVYKIVEENYIEMKSTMNGLSSLGSSKVFKQVEENYTEVKETIDYHM